ncbi:Aldehyde/histidinol dehydrogenase [Cladochytrium replicatum]|nr:Aldehyde/histidinol dehydrogenase [Cladochytrium replicatum]
MTPHSSKVAPIPSSYNATSHHSSMFASKIAAVPAVRSLRTAATRYHHVAATPQLGTVVIPTIRNEPMYDYAPGSTERQQLQNALKNMRSGISEKPFSVPCVVNGNEVRTASVKSQVIPFEHATELCTYHEADANMVKSAIHSALAAKPAWEAMPFADRAAIFLKAADLLSTKYRYDVLAATMLGQGKNVWQAEIDAAAELADFWRFSCKYAADIYNEQPTEHAKGIWNRLEYRPLEGFVVAYSPFNFTAIGGNLVSSPALMGNVVLWKPSNTSIYSSWLVYQILLEAGLPPNVIQFIPGDAEMITNTVLNHPEFAGLHFTGSTSVFKMLWKKIAGNLEVFKSYPRIVGETGGKNMHFVHHSADPRNAALHTIRSAFEYSGQKCSACSRAYVPDSIWETFRDNLVGELKGLKVGPVDDFENFMSAVINKPAYDRITKYIQNVKDGKVKGCEILFGGDFSDKEGYFIQPTVIVTTDPHAPTMVEELFGPVLTIYVYPSQQYEETLELADKTSAYALTAGLFAKDREAQVIGMNKLRNAAGNFYINDKCTGAVVGQQPFGGARASGTNDKAGAKMNLMRWVSARTIKENFLPLTTYKYPSNLP